MLDVEALLIGVFEGRESVLFLAPMGAHGAIAIEAWQVVAQWDLQTDDDDVVHAVRYGTSEGDPEHTQTLTNLEDRIDTAVEDDEFADERMENVDELDDYYEEIGAYDDITPDDGETTTFTPSQPPPVPTCANSTAVTDPGANRELVHDCEVLLGNKDTLAGTATLDWSADAAISDWEGVSTGGTPTRVTKISLSSKGLTGTIPAELGTLFELTVLDLSSNSLTGEIPLELGWLENLEEIRLSGNSLTGCIPVALEDVATNDLSSLGLLYCAPPSPENVSAGTPGEFSILLSWDAVSNTSKYRVEYRQGTFEDWTTDDDTLTGTSHTVDGLSCESGYQFRVSAYGSGTTYAAAWSESSLILSETTGTCPPPVFGAPLYTFAVADDAAAGTVAGTVSATAAAGGAISYSITAGNDDGTFAIDADSGDITVAVGINDATPSPTTLTVEARSSNGGTAQVTVEVHINLPPSGLTVTPTGSHSFTVAWEPVADADRYRVGWSEKLRRYWNEVEAGKLTGYHHSGLFCDRAYLFRVAARIGGVWTIWSQPPVEATCNIAPVFEETSYSFTVEEDAAVGDVAGSISATDAEGESLSYSITAGNDDGHFAITTGSSTTQITVAGALDPEVAAFHLLTVEARDGNGGTATARVGISLLLTECSNGTVVPRPGDNPKLVRDCSILLVARDTLAGDGSLNWSADLLMSSWQGVTVDRVPSLYLKNLLLTDIGLTGSIPAALGGLEDLRRLDLDENELTGEIPPELGRLTSLDQLYLSDNKLSGEIPSELSNLSNLTIMYLNDNKLSGVIPSDFAKLNRLRYLILDGNRLTGGIPSELSGMDSLEQLWVRYNLLAGEIPSELEKLSTLTYLYVEGNGFTGCIPSGLRDVENNDLDVLGLAYCTYAES